MGADSQIKTSIAQILISKEQAIRDNTYGSIVWRNCNLKAFKQGVSTWEESERKKKKNVESFESIINNKSTDEKENIVDHTVDHSTENNEIDVKSDAVNPVVSKKVKKKKRSINEESNDSTNKLKKSKKNKEVKESKKKKNKGGGSD